MNKFKTYAFWLALSSAIVILVQSVGKLFGFEIESSLIENVIMSICGVLVVLGIVTKSNENDEKVKSNKESNNEQSHESQIHIVVENETKEKNTVFDNNEKKDME